MNRIKQIFRTVILFAPFVTLMFVLMFWPPRCTTKSGTQKVESDSIKFQVKEYEKDRNRIKEEASKTEIKQKDVKERWRSSRTNIPKDSTKGRDTILQVVYLCDTLLFVDSVLIGQLKEVIVKDSLIIQGQKEVIRADSLTINSLTAKLKKRNFKTWWKGFKTGFVAGNVTGGIAGSQLAK